MRRRPLSGIAVFAVAGAVALGGCHKEPEPGTVLDEAMLAGLSAEDFPGSDNDYLRDMDKGLTPEEVHARMAALGAPYSQEEAWSRYNRGRNNWAVWTGGNDRFWDEMTVRSFGALDLLKTVSSHEAIYYKYDGKEYPISRDNRWYWFGLINEPCFSKPTGGDPNRYGLWLDVRDPDCAHGPDPFDDAEKYPGVQLGSRGETLTWADSDGNSHQVVHGPGSYYGEPSGIFGLRLFPNPAFDQKAADRWDPVKYYTEPDYYNDRDLVRPYRVGMTCGFCHVGPDPTNPPTDPENPDFAQLNNNPGAQYFWIDRIFFWDQKESEKSYAWQLFHTSQPGALDTSFVSTDYINNPRTMNAVYSVGARLGPAKAWGREKLAEGGSGNNKQFNDYPETQFLSEFFEPPDTVLAPHVLKDGADSVGILGALNRVYLNIGLFSEEWLLHFNPLVGGKPISPIEIEVARKNSAMWNANETQTQDVALFFLVSATPDLLADAPGGEAYLTQDAAQLTRGKEVFAQYCARCHSSKLPEPPANVDVHDWDEYWAWTKTEEFRAAMTDLVLAADFLDDNFLSTEKRIPVTLLGTNACSPLASNGIGDNIWDNFSSQTYKELPSVGEYEVQHPITGEWRTIDMPGGGRGYTRPASLASLWSTAPFGLANSVGKFRWEPSVEARMDSFNDAIEKWLWPEKRVTDVDVVRELGLPESVAQPKLEGYMYRTTEKSYLKVYLGFLPKPLNRLAGLGRFFPWIDEREKALVLGPVPKGTPVNLIANLQAISEDRSLSARAGHFKKVIKTVRKIVKDLKELPQDATDERAREQFANVVDDLVELSACPDYVVNRGHYFGTDRLPASEGEPPLSDDDKWALIEFLKIL